MPGGAFSNRSYDAVAIYFLDPLANALLARWCVGYCLRGYQTSPGFKPRRDRDPLGAIRVQLTAGYSCSQYRPERGPDLRENAMKKRVSLAVAITLGLATSMPAFAQQAATPVQIMATAPAGHTISKYYKQPVYDPQKAKIGTIDDVVISDSGQIEAFIIGVGGFLGMGEKNVAVAPGSVHAEMKDGSWYLTLNTNKDSLKAAPGLTFDKTKSNWVASGKS